MKKSIFFLVLVIMAMAFTIAIADNNPDINNQQFLLGTETLKDYQNSFNLPASLQIIEEEAFEGTALSGVQLPETVTTIEDRAFANTKNLRYIYIPEKTKDIGKDVLAGSKTVIVSGLPGSYAGKWAKKNGIPFASLTLLYANDATLQIPGMISGRILPKELSTNEKTEEPYDSTPKGRTEGEVKAARHEKRFAYSIQGRSPPLNG